MSQSKTMRTESASNQTVDIPWKFMDLVTWKSLKSLGNLWTRIGILQLNYHVFVLNGNKSNYCSILWVINLQDFLCTYIVLDTLFMLFRILQIKLIANRWARGRCLWKQVVVSPEIQDSSRVCRYWPQPREQKPPPGTITRRNSVEILTNHYTHQCQQRRRQGGLRDNLPHKRKIWSSHQLQNFPERVHIIWSLAKTRMSNRDEWARITAQTSIGSILNYYIMKLHLATFNNSRRLK